MGRAAIEGFCGNDPRRFRSIKVRFAAPVMPGETIITDMWKESDTDILCRARVKERNVAVVTNAKVTIRA
jgi:3-hydroxyacyl-CoA dehydrogenase/3a,7a,12a-trihydroxy-5b-cholest-24-enoyl-CoA hydratase